MFSIYGKSRVLAKKIVAKQMLNKNYGVSKQLAKMQNSTQVEKQIVVDKYIDITFAEMKPKRCTHEFSTPHIANEALVLMEKDTGNFTDLVLMKKVNKLTPELKRAVSKTTGKPLMEWVPINQETKEIAA